ncbi:MAG TPA: methyl-accepting chemotaxis protein [Nitrospirae bacterium]|nr:hypothetical protein BMS3Abin06_00623 [bacterium BMS3Abin06]HDH11448.1 methyl-accepting chemotaxis protein [Nitrospirota bacterium]HDZ01398.1 methyl-accepting chemotaxis protein [Nitrospirota bacterium]
MNDKNRRKHLNFSIKRKMQLRLFIKVFTIAIVGVGIMGAIFYFYSDREISSSYRQFHIHAKNFLDLLLPAIVLSLLAALLVSIVITLFFPIKIAGPLYRIERDLKEKLAKGDLTLKFHLRKGDEVDELAEAVNICVANWKKKIETIKKSAEDLEAALRGSEGTENNNVKELVVRLNENLRQFKV